MTYRKHRYSNHNSRLRFEPLEGRRMLATIVVDSALDNTATDGAITLREAIIAANTDSVADAIEGAQTGNGADEIVFAQSLAGVPIVLGGTALTITDSVIIIGLGTHQTIVDANYLSRLLNVDDGVSNSLIDVELQDLTLRRADVEARAIVSTENLSFTNTLVSENRFGLIGSTGGSLTIDDSIIERNTDRDTATDDTLINVVPAAEFLLRDSVIRNNDNARMNVQNILGTVTVENSVFEDNSVDGGGEVFLVINQGQFDWTGGSIRNNGFVSSNFSNSGLTVSSLGAEAVANIQGAEFSGNSGRGLKITSVDGATTHASDLEIVGNTASDPGTGDVSGGGIWVVSSSGGTSLIENSTVSRNRILAGSGEALGGGIYVESDSGDTILRQLTVEGNSSLNSGGGIYVYRNSSGPGNVSIENSTIVGNVSGLRPANGVQGGGVVTNRSVNISNSIIAGNFDGELSSDLWGDIGSDGFQFDHSLIGNNLGTTLVEAGSAAPGANGNIIGGLINGLVDPRLGELTRNGRDRLTMLPNANSPAINAGDPAFAAIDRDQRGGAYERVVEGRIDMGAVERESTLIVDTLGWLSNVNTSAGDLSIREAIEIANLTSGPQRIEFAESLANATLDGQMSGRLDITDDVTIAATDSVPVTFRSSTDIFRVSNPDRQIDVTLSGLTLENSFTAVSSTENLNVIDSTLQDNSGGAIVVGGGALSGRRVEFLNNDGSFGSAGGITLFPNATALVDQSTFFRNVGFAGSAIDSFGAAFEVRNSTFVANVASVGGAISLDATSELSLYQSTVSDNSSETHAGGIYVGVDSTADIRHSTIVRNTADSDRDGDGVGGGIVSPGKLLLSHTIVAENVAGSMDDSDIETRGPFSEVTGNVRLDHSFIGSATGTELQEANPIADENGNLIGGVGSGVIDPQLGPVGQFGGPTETIGLMVQSPAINAGNFVLGSLPGSDQRGEPFGRIQSGRIDIGATERQERPTVYIVDTLDDEMDGDISPGDLSLREAVRESNLGFGNTEIFFAPELNGGTITLSMGELLVTAGVEIRGPGADLLTISGDGANRLFHIDDGLSTDANVRIWDLTLTDGFASDDGGAILSRENLDVRRIQVLDSTASNGGGIASLEGSLSVSDSTIAGNSASSNGGGIFADNFVVTVNQSTISQNSALNGGGLWTSSAISMNNSTVTLNSARNTGGVVSSKGLLINNSIVAGNVATASGEDDISGVVIAASHNFIGNNAGSGLAETSLDEDGNQIGGPVGGIIDPQLLPLADNGGRTLTHLPTSGSPVIDAGTLDFGANDFDQRGMPFSRLIGSQMDIGSVEAEVSSFADFDFDGDFDCDDMNALTTEVANGDSRMLFDVNGDGAVNYDDVLEWLEIAGTENVGGAYIVGDMNLDGVVDVSDFGIFNSNKFTANSAWCSGDITADGIVDVSDFNVWNDHKFQSSVPLVVLTDTPHGLDHDASDANTKADVQVARDVRVVATENVPGRKFENEIWRVASLLDGPDRERRANETLDDSETAASIVADLFALLGNGFREW